MKKLCGFHLIGSLFDQIIDPTIQEIKKISPEYVITTHCTGWKAINQFAKEMPDQFILNGSGQLSVSHSQENKISLERALRQKKILKT